MKDKNSIYLPNMQNFGIWAPLRPLFEIKYQNFSNILAALEDDYFAKKKKVKHLKFQKCNSYIIKLHFSERNFPKEFYTDISCLGGVFAKNTSRETNNFPS